MLQLKCITRDNSSPIVKPSVYFTCHQKDFDRSFKRICDEILNLQDCAIYYVENANKRVISDNMEEIGKCNLFIIPVSLRLLTEINMPIMLDVAYAREHNIPILPIILERGLEPLYSREDKLGELQYLDITFEDSTELSFSERLECYLSSALLSAEKVSAASDAAKKYSLDDALAGDISADDKYLVGLAYFYGAGVEIDRANGLALIKQAAEKDSIGANSVLYELYSWGIYVDTDYDVALEYAKHYSALCLAAEGEASELYLTAQSKLSDAYLYTGELKSAISIAYRASETIKEVFSPTHPLTRKIFLQLAKLSRMIPNGDVMLSLASDVARYYLETPDVNDADRLAVLINLAMAHREVEDFENAMILFENIYDDAKAQLGEEHPASLDCLGNIGSVKLQTEKYEEALKIIEPLYEVKSRVLGKDNPNTWDTLHEIAMIYSNLGDSERAEEIYSEVIELINDAWGANHPEMIPTLQNKLEVCVVLGDNDKINDTLESIYKCLTTLYGEYSIKAVNIAQALAKRYIESGLYLAAISRLDVVIQSTCDIPEYAGHAENAMKQIEYCIHRINDTSIDAFENGYLDKALVIQKQVYELRSTYLGSKHKDTIISQNDIAVLNYKLGNIDEALEDFEYLYELQSATLADTDEAIISTLGNITKICLNIEDYKKAVSYLAKKHDVECRAFSEVSMPAFDTIDLLCKSCIMVIDKGDTSVFTTELVGAYNGKILKIFKDIVNLYLSAEEYSAARKIYEIIYRYYSEVEGIDSQNALEYKASIDEIPMD